MVEGCVCLQSKRVVTWGLGGSIYIYIYIYNHIYIYIYTYIQIYIYMCVCQAREW